MSVEYTFIGWCRDEEANADKVWGIMKLTGNGWTGSYVSFWGRRGKKLQTKLHKDEYEWNMEKLVDQKARKGYKGIDKDKLDTVYPEFQADLEKTAFWNMFKV
jgi:predicted DNA-binding WGR domain protein